MNWINEFKLQPGTYQDADGQIVVVTDVVTKLFYVDLRVPDTLQDPLVVTRDLIDKALEHNRVAYPLSLFNQKFKKV